MPPSIHIDKAPRFGKQSFGLLLFFVGSLFSLPSNAELKAADPNEFDTDEALSFDRSNFGNGGLPIWSPLTDFEIQILTNRNALDNSEPGAVLAFYLIASGDVRTREQFQALHSKYKQWVDVIALQADKIRRQEHLAKFLYEEMHKQFFIENTATSGSPTGYAPEQSKLSDVFLKKTYNCISSALLYVTIANHFGIDARGVLIPSHAFVQLNLDNGKVIEVETTVPQGFNVVHNERYYRENAGQLSEDLELEPATYEDYLKRDILSPLGLGLQNIWNQHTFPQTMSYRDRMRLAEIRAFLQPDHAEVQLNRLYFYNREANFFIMQQNYTDMARMFNAIEPWMNSLTTATFDHERWPGIHAMLHAHKALGLVMTDRPEEGLELAHKLLEQTPDNVDNYDSFRQNVFFVLTQFIIDSVNDGGFTRARRAIRGYEQECLNYTHCTQGINALYAQWSQMFWKQKNWPQAMRIIKEYLDFDDASERSLPFWQSFEVAHLNQASDFLYDEDRRGAENVLNDCITNIKAASRCKSALSRLERHGTF